MRGLLRSPLLVLFIYARMWGLRVCQWSDCLPRSSHTPPFSVPPQPRESSPPRCPSPPLLPVWMNVYFLFPWCRTPLPFDSLSVLVVRGGAVCLPTLPSWFSQFVDSFEWSTYSIMSFENKFIFIFFNLYLFFFLPYYTSEAPQKMLNGCSCCRSPCLISNIRGKI